MEPRAVGRPDEQGRDNILLHVHLEGKPHPLWNSKRPAVCTGRPNRLRIRSPSLDPGGRPVAAWDQLLTIYSPPRGPAAVLRGVPAHPPGAVTPGDGDGGGGATTPREDFEVPE